MIPQDKAEHLLQLFHGVEITREECKTQALHCVREIMDALNLYDEQTEKYLKDEFGIDYTSCELQNMDSDLRYWYAVEKILMETK